MVSPTDIPFADDSFDAIICACVYHHIEPDIRERHMAEIKRVLRPGGLFFIFEHNPRNVITQLIVRRCPLDAETNLLGSGEARSLMRRGGFADVATRYYLFLPEFLYRMFRWTERVLSHTTLGGQYCTVGTNA